MPRILSGTLRFWNDGEQPSEVTLDRLTFAFMETYEPSMIVEDIFLAFVDGHRVHYGEFEGVADGMTIKVKGAQHAALKDWGVHATPTRELSPRPDFMDTHTETMRPF